jgi:hypothetical protein
MLTPRRAPGIRFADGHHRPLGPRLGISKSVVRPRGGGPHCPRVRPDPPRSGASPARACRSGRPWKLWNVRSALSTAARVRRGRRGPRGAPRVQREAEVLATLNHPNIDIASALDKTDRSGIIHRDLEDHALGRRRGMRRTFLSTPTGFVVVEHWFEELREPGGYRRPQFADWSVTARAPRRSVS